MPVLDVSFSRFGLVPIFPRPAPPSAKAVCGISQTVADLSAGTPVVRLAVSSHSGHECDDTAERFIVICDEMEVRSTADDQWIIRATLNESGASCESWHLSDVA